jgi:NADH-quinone oxidoreductase subunit L
VNENDNTAELLRWIALLPLMTATFHGVALGLLRWSAPRWLTIALSCGSVGLAFVLSCVVMGQLLALPEGSRFLVDPLYTWIASGSEAEAFRAELAFALDPISAVMILVVTGVGSLIHVYSIGYMDDDHREDRGFQRFFCYLNLFTFAMLVLVLADNLLLMFVGWEGVGLCSYLLIGFWYSDRFNAYCGSKAFIVNRIGDFGFLLGIFLVFWALSDGGAPSVAFADLKQNLALAADKTIPVPAWMPFGPDWKVLEVAALCFFLGACGKSAQIPLYTWLPDAMAGPTPVSALIHAATMVTAGVYMVCRLSFLYALTPGASSVVAWVGALTALFAATIAINQTDIKKVLAYSTVSQLGYMLLAAGCGGYTAALFHLGTHAFFKALLFLGAGAVILAVHHEQDTDKMGGLWSRLRRTRWVFLIGVLAIAGFPGFSGFFSKDEVLLSAFASHVPGHLWLYGIGLVTAGITAFYMFRLFFRTFAGECRGPAEMRDHAHDPSSVVMIPLYVLAFFSVFAGFVGLPQAYGFWVANFGVEESNSFAVFLRPALPEAEPHAVSHATEYLMALAAVGMAAAGALLAWGLYVFRPGLPVRIAGALPGLYRTLRHKYYVDEIYDAAIVRPLVRVSDRVLFRGVDAGVIDGAAVNGTARAIRGLAANGLKYAQTGLAQSYIFFMVVGAVILVGYLVR